MESIHFKIKGNCYISAFQSIDKGSTALIIIHNEMKRFIFNPMETIEQTILESINTLK